MSEIKTRWRSQKWGLSMEEGTIAQWLIKGVIALIRAMKFVKLKPQKIVQCVRSAFCWNVRKILAKDGDTLPVGDLLPYVPIMISDAEIEKFIALGGSADSSSTCSTFGTK